MDSELSYRAKIDIQKSIDVDLPNGMNEIPDMTSLMLAMTKAVNIEYNTPKAEAEE